MESLVHRISLIEKLNNAVMPKAAYYSADGQCTYANRPFLDWCGASDSASLVGGAAQLVLSNLPVPGFGLPENPETSVVECQLGDSCFQICYTLDYAEGRFLGYMVRVDAVPQGLQGKEKSRRMTWAAEPEFGSLLETISESFCIIDSGWEIQYWNSAAELTTGQQKQDVLGKNIWDVFPQERDSGLFEKCLLAMKERTFCAFEHNSITGTWYYNSIHPTAQGGLIIYFKDVTERRLAEEQLIEIRNNLHGMLNATDDLMWSVDSQCRLIAANAAFTEYIAANKGYRYAAGDVVVVDKHSGERSHACEKLYHKCLEGHSFSYQDLSMADRLTRYNPIFRSDGSVSGVACHSTDLSEMRRLEKEKTNSAERFRALVQNGSDLIFIFGEGYTLEYVSPSALSVLGESRVERKELMGLLHEDDYPLVLAAFKAGKHRKTFTVEPFRIRSASGGWLWIEAIVDNLLDNPAVAGTVVNGRDVTAIMDREAEHQSLIKELVRSNSDLTQFSYITSHNLRAPLSNILGILAYMDRSGANPELEEALAMMDAASLDLKSTLDDLSTLLLIRNGAAGQRVKLDIVKTFHLANQSYAGIESQIEARLHLDFAARSVNYSRQYLESLFSCLISNAIKFRKQGRRLEINVSSRMEACGKVVIRFEDNGLGIDVARHGKRLFGMYQRFHSDIDGKGLSLFIAQAQLQSLGGIISVESAPDVFTAFTISIPA